VWARQKDQVKEQCQDKIGETNAFSVFYEKRAMLVTMSHPPADRSMYQNITQSSTIGLIYGKTAVAPILAINLKALNNVNTKYSHYDRA